MREAFRRARPLQGKLLHTENTMAPILMAERPEQAQDKQLIVRTSSWEAMRHDSLPRRPPCSSSFTERMRCRPRAACSLMASRQSTSPSAMLRRKRAVASPVSATMPAVGLPSQCLRWAEHFSARAQQGISMELSAPHSAAPPGISHPRHLDLPVTANWNASDLRR